MSAMPFTMQLSKNNTDGTVIERKRFLCCYGGSRFPSNLDILCAHMLNSQEIYKPLKFFLSNFFGGLDWVREPQFLNFTFLSVVRTGKL